MQGHKNIIKLVTQAGSLATIKLRTYFICITKEAIGYILPEDCELETFHLKEKDTRHI